MVWDAAFTDIRIYMINPKNIDEVRTFFHKNKDDIIEKYHAIGAGIGKKNPQDEGYVIVVYLQDKQFLPENPVILSGVPLKFEITGKLNLQS